MRNISSDVAVEEATANCEANSLAHYNSLFKVFFFFFLNHQPPLDSQFPAIAPYKYLKEFCHFFFQDNTRDSIQSSSSAEDDIYERLSLKSVSPSGAVTPCDGETNTKNEESFMFPSPPKTPLESTGTGIYVGGRPGSFRASGGKGKLSTGW